MMNSDAGLASSGKKGMAWARRFSFFVILVSLVASSTLVSSDEDDYGHCERIVENWAISSGESGGEEDKLTLKDMLFFLHVPRTGGRTYFHCFLRKLYTTAQECPRSYDRLRFDPRKPNCKLVTTHDDYSLISKLPKDRTSVVTILRNPVDRVFSTYEFSIEVAARFLVHPNLTSAKQMSSRIRTKSRGVSTLDIWPWKYLVPWMREDLFARRDARKLGKLWSDETSDVYNMEHVVMPLHEFINDPIAHEIIHNGATFQVAGLTNNSYIMESHEVRNCVRKYPVLGRLVLEVAKSRLDQMLYVGLTEDHKESARMFVNMVAAQVLSHSEDLNSSAVLESSNRTEFSSSKPDIEDEGLSKVQSSNNSQQVGEVPSADAASGKENVAIRKSMEAYEVCIASLRKSQSTRRTLSLKRIAPANFSKEARLMVPQTLLNHIVALNSLDVELYKHAQSIFVQQKQLLLNGQHIFVEKQEQLVAEKELIKTWNNLYGCSPGMIFLLAILILLMIAFVSLVCTRRRTSKLKV